MTDKEVQEAVARADAEYDMLKDRVHEQYDEIERLKEEYMILQNASDEVEEEKDKEIERLNNILDKFEEELEKEINIKEEDVEVEHERFVAIHDTLENVLSRFLLIKGVDKE